MQQIESVKPQMNPLSPLILSDQPRSSFDFIKQSPSHNNGGRGQAEASLEHVVGTPLGSKAHDWSSTESVLSCGSNGSNNSLVSKSRKAPKIITGISGQDPMSVDAYRRFVGSAAAKRGSSKKSL